MEIRETFVGNPRNFCRKSAKSVLENLKFGVTVLPVLTGGAARSYLEAVRVTLHTRTTFARKTEVQNYGTDIRW